MTLNADTGCGGGGTVSFVDRREKVTSSGKKILICRSPGSGEPGPGTTAYVTPTHSHRRSCPASPGKPGPGAAAGAVAGFQRARRSLSASSPDVPAGRAQRRQRHAGRASLAGGQVVRQASDDEVGRIPGQVYEDHSRRVNDTRIIGGRRRLAAGDPAPERRASGSGLARSMDRPPRPQWVHARGHHPRGAAVRRPGRCWPRASRQSPPHPNRELVISPPSGNSSSSACRTPGQQQSSP
jgi:hypothetical protein